MNSLKEQRIAVKFCVLVILDKKFPLHLNGLSGTQFLTNADAIDFLVVGHQAWHKFRSNAVHLQF